jgi:hypothetical protein
MSRRVTSSIVVAAAALAGCTFNQHLPQTGVDHVSGWSNEVRKTAAEAFLYAQLATNVYDDPSEMFRLDPSIVRVAFQADDRFGYGYAFYRRPIAGGEEKILVFRGTDFSQGRDWIHGNIAAYQNILGLQTFRRLRDKYKRDGDWVVAGHSLGGGIATYVSMIEPNVRSYAFNSSPRFRAPPTIQDNRRNSIVEYGEVLKATRIFGREAPQLYTSIGCTSGINVIRQHKMRLLAECLTQIGAYESQEAQRSLILNPEIARPRGIVL